MLKPCATACLRTSTLTEILLLVCPMYDLLQLSQFFLTPSVSNSTLFLGLPSTELIFLFVVQMALILCFESTLPIPSMIPVM